MNKRQTLSFGTIVGGYTIIRCIGQGGFGDVYLVNDNETGQAFAMKIELISDDRQSIYAETCYLMNLQGSPYFPRLITYQLDKKPRYIVQELLGPSLSALKRMMPENKFSLCTVLLIAQETVKILQELHCRGYIHNDIKPSNFLVRPNTENFICLIDFGLSNEYISDITGEVKKIKCVGFNGTKKYASPNIHDGMDIHIRDDLYSWFYTILDLLCGSLPWKVEQDYQDLLNAKKELTSHTFFSDLPEQLQNIYYDIESLEPEEAPDYEHWLDEIDSALSDEIEKGEIEAPYTFEWEKFEILQEIQCSTIPLKLREGKYAIEPDFYNLKIDSENKLVLNSTEEGTRPKYFHPLSTVCNIA